MSKELLSNDTHVQGDYCPTEILSKEAFTMEKLTQNDYVKFQSSLTVKSKLVILGINVVFPPSQLATISNKIYEKEVYYS